MAEELTRRASDRERRNLPTEHSAQSSLDQYRGDLYPGLEDDGGGVDFRRYLYALVRFKWLFVVALLIGVWTWRYWVRTKPAAVAEEPDPTTVFPGS